MGRLVQSTSTLTLFTIRERKSKNWLQFGCSSSFIPDVKYRGWAGRVKVDFPWEKFNFGMVGMYASGADANKTSTRGYCWGLLLPIVPLAILWCINLPQSRSAMWCRPGSEQSPAAGGLMSRSLCTAASTQQADGGTGIAQAGNYQQ